MRKPLCLLLLFALGALMAFAVSGLPPRGDAKAPSHRLVNPAGAPVAGTYYIRHAYADARTPNMVTVILADYRGFDTLGETLVVFTGSVAVWFILRRRKP
ncbi:MAG: hydrogen gas-evolving membrane-bound hydrogenase subunit E [Desulfobacterales bacterium]